MAKPPNYLHEAIDAAITEWSAMPWDACKIPQDMQHNYLVGMVRDAVWDKLFEHGQIRRIPPQFYKDDVTWELAISYVPDKTA